MAEILVYAGAVAIVLASYGIIGAGFVLACDRFDPNNESSFLLRIMVACLWPVAMFAALVIAYEARNKDTT